MAAAKKAFTYEGRDADVTWDGRLCIHAEECVRARGDLFEVGRKDWYRQGDTDADTVVEVVRRCPTGAMTVVRGDDLPAERPDEENVVMVAAGGPLYVRGDLRLEGAPDDMPGVRFRTALCRCGHSKNKPFCDGSHTETGFDDPGAVGQTGPGLESKGGPLDITRSPDGPLRLAGNLTIRAASGRVAWKGTKAALCRCGHSKNKPFCDGSHREGGFEAD